MEEYKKLLEYLGIESISKKLFEENLKKCYMPERYKDIAKEIYVNNEELNMLAAKMCITKGSMKDINNKIRKMLKREENIAILKTKEQEKNSAIELDSSILVLFPRNSTLNCKLVNVLFRCHILTVRDLVETMSGERIIKTSYGEEYTSIGRCKGIGVDSVKHIVTKLLENDLIKKENIVPVKINNKTVL